MLCLFFVIAAICALEYSCEEYSVCDEKNASSEVTSGE